MARIVKNWTAEFGRDKGKVYRITEMIPRVGHDWATRLLMALAGSVSEIDEAVMDRGLAGVAMIFAGSGDLVSKGANALVPAAASLVGKMHPAIAKQLMNELLDCVEIVFGQATRKLIDDDFEEILTIAQLQREVFKLHVEPFTSADRSTSGFSPTAQ